MTEIKIVASSSSWIEGEAVRQLHKTAELSGMLRAVGMPDLHPGQGYPVGTVFVTEDIIFPALVGSDIGCGIGLWTTSIQQTRPERLEKKLKGLESGIDSPETYLKKWGVEPCGFEHSLGTIGRGNHFAELLVLDDIQMPERIDDFIDPSRQKNALLLVHSGSRGFGEKILYDHTAIYQDKGLHAITDEAWDYLNQHYRALEWAELNRRIIADRMLDCLGASGDRVLDVVHNFVESHGTNVEPTISSAPVGDLVWVHRKGAIPSDRGPVVIPGSRGAHSYLVEPIGNDEETGWSLSHGAGRKMSRKDARNKYSRGDRPFNPKKLVQTRLGSYVICEDKLLLLEEAPEAYKPIGRVINDLVEYNLVRIIATLKPILTYKMRRAGSGDADDFKDNRKPKHVKNRDA